MSVDAESKGMPVIVWVNCYGAWDPLLRHPIETFGYNDYLNRIVDYLGLVKERIHRIHLSGGMRDGMHRTECETTLPELKRRLALRDIDVPIITDEDSITTIGIVRTFVHTMANDYPVGTYPLLFCDQVRGSVNRYLVNYFSHEFHVGINPRDAVIPIPRLDNNRNSTWLSQTKKLAAMRVMGVKWVEQREELKRAEHRRPLPPTT